VEGAAVKVCFSTIFLAFGEPSQAQKDNGLYVLFSVLVESRGSDKLWLMAKFMKPCLIIPAVPNRVNPNGYPHLSNSMIFPRSFRDFYRSLNFYVVFLAKLS
jgi:hypothetical protein